MGLRLGIVRDKGHLPQPPRSGHQVSASSVSLSFVDAHDGAMVSETGRGLKSLFDHLILARGANDSDHREREQLQQDRERSRVGGSFHMNSTTTSCRPDRRGQGGLFDNAYRLSYEGRQVIDHRAHGGSLLCGR